MTVGRKILLLLLAAALVVVCLYACEKGGSTPGEKLDRVLEKTGEKVKDAGEAIQPR